MAQYELSKLKNKINYRTQNDIRGYFQRFTYLVTFTYIYALLLFSNLTTFRCTSIPYILVVFIIVFGNVQNETFWRFFEGCNVTDNAYRLILC